MVAFSGPIWRQSRDGAVLLAARRYIGSRSRKTKGSLADTLQCNIWRRAQTPHRMTHRLHGGDNHGKHNGFTALGRKIGTSKSTQQDSDYVTEHQVLKYLKNKIAHYLHDLKNKIAHYLHEALNRLPGASSALSLKCHVNHEQTMCKPECMTCMPGGAGIGAGCAKSDSTK